MGGVVVFSSKRSNSVTRRLGLQERASIPLLAYFATVGAALTVLLLLLNFVLEPDKPEPAHALATGTETQRPQQRSTTGFGPTPAGVISSTPPAIQAEVPEPTTANSLHEALDLQSGSGAVAQKWLAQPKRKSRKVKSPAKGRSVDAVWRRHGSGQFGYAQEKPQSSAEGTLGPH
jgi:hypothetical protein